MDWSILPEPVTTRILQYLPFEDRCRATSVCPAWKECFSSPAMWEQTIFTFQVPPRDFNLLKYVHRFGHLIQRLTIKVDQDDRYNRSHALEVLKILSRLEKRRLNSLTVMFLVEVDVVSNGRKEFVKCLKKLFKVGDRPQFKSVDFDVTDFSIGDDLVDVLTENSPDIETLHIQCDVLTCEVRPDCIKRVLKRCRKLRDVSLLSPSLTEDILRMFTEENRDPLEQLSLMMRSDQQFIEPISSQAWKVIRRHLPDFRVSLEFDSSCTMEEISAVMMLDIPVSTMTFCVNGPAPEEENILCLPLYYKETMENLIIHPMMSTVRLQQALIAIAQKCTRLKLLLVFCVLPVDVIQQVLKYCPFIRSSGTYILKSEAEPEPTCYWVMAKDSPDWIFK